MKTFSFFASVLAAALAMVSCQKPVEEPKDTTPAELKSFSLLKADNSALDEDLTVEISQEMILRVKGGGVGKTFVATLKAGENDVIKVNDKQVGADGKASFDATYPVDIVVTNTKSELKASYVVKIGKILGIVGKANATYLETGCNHGTSVFVAVNPKDGKPYVLYDRTSAGESNANLSVVKWNGTAFDMITSGLADNSTRKPIGAAFDFDADGNAYILHYGEKTANIMGVKKYNGTVWGVMGAEEFGPKISTAFGNPEFAFNGGKVYFAVSGNDKKITSSYRNADVWSFDGAAWNETPGITGLPAFNSANNYGMFYKGATLSTKDAAYMVTSCNWYGYYLYQIKDNAFTKLVDNFIPGGEQYGVPSNLAIRTSADGKIYIFAAHSAAHQMQIYRYNEEQKTFDKYADPLEFSAGSGGGIAESASFFILPTGEFVVVKINNADGDKYPYFCILDENRQWSSWTKIEVPNQMYGKFSAAMTSDGAIFGAYESRLPVGETNTGHLESFTIAYEADILPE